MGSCFQALTGRFLSVPSAKPKTLESHTVLRLQAQLVLIWDFWNARLSYEDSLQFSFIYIVTNHNRSLYLGKVKTLEYYRKPQKPQQSVAPPINKHFGDSGKGKRPFNRRKLQQNLVRGGRQDKRHAVEETEMNNN